MKPIGVFYVGGQLMQQRQVLRTNRIRRVLTEMLPQYRYPSQLVDIDLDVVLDIPAKPVPERRVWRILAVAWHLAQG